jgi:hypothetical protein
MFESCRAHWLNHQDCGTVQYRTTARLVPH